MNKDEAKAEAKSRLGEYLLSLGIDAPRAARSGTNCPICGGGHETPCFHFYEDTNSWACFSEKIDGRDCRTGDIFELYAAINGGDPQSGDTFRAVYNMLGITVDGGSSFSGENARSIPATPATPPAPKEPPKETFEAFFLQARQHITEDAATAYLAKRGISIATAHKFGLGYVADWRSPKVPVTVPTSPRLIIPRGKYSYLARDVRSAESIPESARPYVKQQAKIDGAEKELFNAAAIDNTVKPLYVVEGEFDAMSICEVGGSAVGLGSKGNWGKLLSMIADRRSAVDGLMVITALDNDGKTADDTRGLLHGLQELGIPAMAADTDSLFLGTKDANEALTANRELFASRIIKTKEEFQKMQNDENNERMSEYVKRISAISTRDNFLSSLDVYRPLLNTGYPVFNHALSGWKDGGLSAGLYVVGAISSLGKTTFLLQMMDQIAASGHDVLFFSLEMSTEELVGKSVSRTSFLQAHRQFTGDGTEISRHSYSWRDIRDFKRKFERGLFPNINARKDIESAAAEYYEKIAKHSFIIEGSINSTTMQFIAETVKDHKSITGNSPVVMVDYLQMVAAPEEMKNASDKMIMDEKIRFFKCMSRDFDIPVILISAFNRESYYKPVSLSSFKESGAIEYTADVVLGLQFPRMKEAKGTGAAEKGAEIITEESDKNVRDVEVRILKNRSGSKAETPKYKFYAMYNYFAELDEQ